MFRLSLAQKRLLTEIFPNLEGLVWYAIFGAGITLFHIAALSHSAGTVFPNLLGEDAPLWATAITLTFVNPVDAVLNGNIAAVAGTAILWGLVGAVIYKLIDGMVTFFRDAISTEHEIAVTESGNVVHHPSRRYFALRVGWHIILGLVILVSGILFIPVVRLIMANDPSIIQAHTVLELLKEFSFSTLAWMVLFHWYVVLLRLFRFFYLA